MYVYMCVCFCKGVFQAQISIRFPGAAAADFQLPGVVWCFYLNFNPHEEQEAMVNHLAISPPP